MKDLLKEAIADAKAVRETALANAKLALEEAFTPRLQSMLSAKLAEEMSDEDEMETEGEEEMHHEEAPEAEAPAAEEAPEETPEEPEMEEEGMDMEGEDELDLESIIKELEMDEDMESSEIGSGDNKMADYDASTEDEDDSLYEGEDEEVDINEIIRALQEEDEEMEEEPVTEGEEEMEAEPESKEELEEAYNVIRFLKGKINEVNLLNAKLLYSNKLFRNFTLTEGQKMKVIENFDRAYNLREVKLVYTTLAESFKGPKVVMKESFASKPIASTKPAKQVISEGAELAARFQKLAGLKK